MGSDKGALSFLPRLMKWFTSLRKDYRQTWLWTPHRLSKKSITAFWTISSVTMESEEKVNTWIQDTVRKQQATSCHHWWSQVRVCTTWIRRAHKFPSWAWPLSPVHKWSARTASCPVVSLVYQNNLGSWFLDINWLSTTKDYIRAEEDFHKEIYSWKDQ